MIFPNFGGTRERQVLPQCHSTHPKMGGQDTPSLLLSADFVGNQHDSLNVVLNAGLGSEVRQFKKLVSGLPKSSPKQPRQVDGDGSMGV